ACSSPPGGEAEATAAPGAGSDAGAQAPLATAARRSRGGLVPLSPTAAKEPESSEEVAYPLASSNNDVTYNGGAVISNVHVVPVFWGPGVFSTIQSEIGCFYDAVVRSP